MDKKQPQSARQKAGHRPAPRKKQGKFRMPRTYREFERLMSWVLGIDVMLLLIYLMAAARGVGWLKNILAGLAIACAVLSVGFLFLNRELNRPRSRWLVTGFCAIVVCLLVSLLFRYPRPAPTEADIQVDSSISASTDASVNQTDAAG